MKCINPLRICLITSLVALVAPSLFANIKSYSFPPLPRDFLFGVATAPAHIEDQLDDVWLRFAENGHVAAFHNHADPDKRLRFWTQPEKEIRLAAETGVQVFRMGIDWGRLMPSEPTGNSSYRAIDQDALERYVEIVDLARDRGMVVMLTLFHHSIPVWAEEKGGWANPDMVQHFLTLVRVVVHALADRVDLWVTMNEPTIYGLLTHVGGLWPPGEVLTPMESLWRLTSPFGPYKQAMAHLSEAHNLAFDSIHDLDRVTADPSIGKGPAHVGIAHLVNNIVPDRLIDTWAAWSLRLDQRYAFVDQVVDHLDFLGINYYGRETIKGLSIPLQEGVEYSQSGRQVDPEGLYQILLAFHQRYNVDGGSPVRLPIWITENGVADDTDLLRRPYILEHLAATHQALQQGVPVEGFIFWTVSDNWEWADGYCPKFGLVAVDRNNKLKRTKRPSFDLVQSVVRSRTVTFEQRQKAWADYQEAAMQGKRRQFCRHDNGEDALTEPVMRPFGLNDWRFLPAADNEDRKLFTH